MTTIVLFTVYFVGIAVILVKSHDRYVIRDTRRSLRKISGYHLSRKYFSIMMVIAILWPLLVAALIVEKIMLEADK